MIRGLMFGARPDQDDKSRVTGPGVRLPGPPDPVTWAFVMAPGRGTGSCPDPGSLNDGVDLLALPEPQHPLARAGKLYGSYPGMAMLSG
jgi:hypothetical protein